MGQYYKVAFKSDNDGIVHTNSRGVEGMDYILAKLMEHSYFGNVVMDAVASELEKGITHLIWVGDYADDGDEVLDKTCGDLKYEDVWGEHMRNEILFKKVKFDYKGKFLVNHYKKVYISFDDYLKNDTDGWAINPISILTCIGNGRGGGDYRGTNMDKVGTWAWDGISITSVEPDDMEKIDLVFSED